MYVRHVATVFLAAAVGCYHPGSRPATGGHDLITHQELERVKDMTLYEAVAKLRPHFFRNRTVAAHGKEATGQLMLYVDGEKMDSVDDLRRLYPSDAQEVRFYEPQLANTYFARYNNAAGAIAVKLRKFDSEIPRSIPSTRE